MKTKVQRELRKLQQSASVEESMLRRREQGESTRVELERVSGREFTAKVMGTAKLRGDELKALSKLFNDKLEIFHPDSRNFYKLFKQMDLDGNGTIDKKEFEMAVTSSTMRKFFKVIDAQISEDGEITPEEWLKGMGLIGRNMGDAEFNRLLNEMVGDLQTASATVAERNRCFGLAKCAKCFA